MSDVYIGQLIPVAFNYAPNGFALCNGQSMSISSYAALFAVIGTTYGGNGTTTFDLPDLRGRVPVHYGTGPGLPAYTMGESGGAVATVLSATQLPSHSHSLPASDASSTSSSPTGAVPAAFNSYGPAPGNVHLAPSGTTGAGTPVPTLPPFLTINWLIALTGIFPSRS